MPVRFRCASCDAKLSVSQRKAGTNVQCPRCSSPTLVPLSERSTSASHFHRAPESTLTLPHDAVDHTSNVARYYRAWALTAAACACGCLATYAVLGSPFNSPPNTSDQTPLLVAQATTPNVVDDVLQAPAHHADEERSEAASWEFELDSTTTIEARGLESATALADQAPQALALDEVNHASASEPVAASDATVSPTTSVETHEPVAVEPEPEPLHWLVERRQTIARPTSLEPADYVDKLQQAPEVGIDDLPRQEASNRVMNLAGKTQHPLELTLLSRGDLQGLPFQMGKACLSSSERANQLTRFGQTIKSLTQASSGSSVESFVTALNKAAQVDLNSAVPAMVQVAQSGPEEARAAMIEYCKDCDSRESTVVLAKRAVFDQSKRIRERAITALKDRPAELYRPELLSALRYPFAPVVQNAAVAIAELELTDAVPVLRAMLDEPDPTAAQFADNDSSQRYVRELVRINHFANCTLCHAPSVEASDSLRGIVPKYGQEIPVAYYASQSPGNRMIRADVTYLKQDFAVQILTIDKSKWPDYKRFDFVTRVRPATLAEIQAADKPSASPSEFKRPLVFALRRLNDIDHGDSIDAWKARVPADPQLAKHTITLPATLDSRSQYAKTAFFGLDQERPAKFKKKS